MKFLKTKLFSLILCICMCLSFFSGCSLVATRNSADANATVITIGETKITRQKLVDAYYTFYQQNSSYYAYYDEKTIIDSFYNSFFSKEIVLVEANKMLKAGTLKFSDEDMTDVWNDVFDYIYAQVDAKEKALLLAIDSDEENLPKRLHEHDHSEDEKAYKYEAYEREEVKQEDDSAVVASTITKKVDSSIIDRFLDELYMYNSVDPHDEDVEEDRVMVDIADDEVAKREEAFNMYLSNLILSAKANKKDSDKDVVLTTEIQRIFDVYYENAVYAKYKEYINSTISGELEDYENKFSDKAIAEKYKKLLNASIENNSLEENYVSVVSTSGSDSLILYHYSGTHAYFNVQHILIPFSEETIDILKEIDGYDTSKDLIIRKQYESLRETYVSDDMTTTYRGEDGLTVYEQDGETKSTVTIKEIEDSYAAEVANIDASSMTAEEKTRAKVMLFNKFAWKYSGDTGSLTNDKLSGVLGFTISSESDEHGSFVKDFTNGARSMYEAFLQDSGANGIGSYKRVVTDYGVHIMMLTGVYQGGPVIDIQEGKTDAEIVSLLKSNYISNLTEQTVYDYIYDIIKEELIGEKGTYFTEHINEKMAYYKEKDLIKDDNKLSLDELNKAIN